MRNFLKAFTATVLLYCIAATAAHATIVQVSSVAGLTQGAYSLENFEDSSFVSGFSASATGGTSLVSAAGYAGGVTPSGVLGLSTSFFPRPITFSFTSAASSVGMYFGNDDTCCSGGFTAFLDIFDANGFLSTIAVVANMNDRADQFIGFISDELVTSVTLRYGSGSNVSLYTYVDDLRFNVASQSSEVPAPASMALVSLGALAVGAMRRRRQHKQHL